jgi:hypothetical protein
MAQSDSKEGRAAATGRFIRGERGRLQMTGMRDQGHGESDAPDKLDAADETRRRIDEMNLRIQRQRRRIESMLYHRQGPTDAMQVLLDDMIKASDLMRAQLEAFEAERDRR